MIKQAYFLILLLPLAQSAAERDWSFQEMCEFYHGQYTPRDGYAALGGDTCKLSFAQATSDEESAIQYCETQVPYHINKATPGARTTCDAEATLICDSNWVQMFGRCYKITKRLMKHEEAEKHCAAERKGSTIAFLHREALPFRIKDYFTSVSRFWLEASETMTQDLIYDVKGGHLLLAIDGYRYNLPNIALARVSPDETAMALCEYKPKMTQSESSNLLKRLGEIYYPTVTTPNGVFVRTASSLTRAVDNNFAENAYCSRMMRPFIPGGQAQSAIPTRDFIDEVIRVNENEKSLIVRTSAFSRNSKQSERELTTCVASQNPIFQIFLSGKDSQPVPLIIGKDAWQKGEPKEVCDAATWSSGIVLSHSEDPGLEAMSDARYAPLYCQSITENFKYGGCPAGYSMFHRKQLGQKWCHKFINVKLNYDDAQKECQKEGAFLSGFTSQEEYAFMTVLIGNIYDPRFGTEETWVGAKRREECNVKGAQGKIPGYDRDPNSRCSRNRVFEWQNGVAPNPMVADGLWMSWYEPNYQAEGEMCLVIMKTTAQAVPVLNDLSCAHLLRPMCGKEAPIILA
uniref:C-type lectin domain-containing protein n=1 Tax=Caenorhabditis tropicalis TaxID=1561998 RepID=A0A1I7U2F2_9PELO